MAALRSLSLVALLVPGVALAQPAAAPPPSLTPPPAAEDEPEEVVEGFVLPPSAEATPPFVLMGYEHYFTISIGISLSTSMRDRAEEMLRDADLGMYRAKE